MPTGITSLGLIGASLAGSAMGGLFGMGNQAMSVSQQKRLFDYQYSKNLEMWNLQNEYNDPSKQIERLMNAGLNPNLAYGHGTLANTSAQMPQTSMPHVNKADTPQFDVLGAVTAAQDMKLKEAQSNILGQQALTEVAKRENLAADKLKTLADTARQQQDTEFGKKMFPYTFDYQKLINDKVSQEIRNLSTQNTTEVSRNQNMIADTALKNAQTLNTQGQTNLQPLQARQIAANIVNTIQQTSESGQRINLIAKQVQSIDKDLSLKDAQIIATQIDNYYQNQGINKSGIVSDMAKVLQTFIRRLKGQHNISQHLSY
nr:MAG: DNA pilot protein [Microvirus sp.]